jgi:GGDEF domain-containing protein
VDEQIKVVSGQPNWHILDCRLESFRPFVDLNGFAAGDEVLKFTAQLLREVVDRLGTAEDFVGHPGNDTFLILTAAPDAAALATALAERFNEDVKAHYGFMDAEQGYIVIRDSDGRESRAPLMTLRVSPRKA